MMAIDEIAAYQLADGSALTLYLRPNHVAPENTSVTFIVSDIEAEMADLRSRGVTFEDYDMPGIKTLNGLATEGMGGSRQPGSRIRPAIFSASARCRPRPDDPGSWSAR